MELELEKNTVKPKNSATKELSYSLNEYLKKNEKAKKVNSELNQYDKYIKYWDNYEAEDFESMICARLGIGLSSKECRFENELTNNLDESIFEISKKVGTPLYLISRYYFLNWTKDQKRQYLNKNSICDIEQYKDGQKKTLEDQSIHIASDKSMEYVKSEKILENLVAQVDERGNATIRNDLKEEILELACEKSKHIRDTLQERAKDYKKEGHVYFAYNNSNTTFLEDITDGKSSIEDLDFLVDDFKGEGTYKVINGKYKKISDKFDSSLDKNEKKLKVEAKARDKILSKSKKELDSENYIKVLQTKFNLTDEDTEILDKKVDNYLQEFARSTGELVNVKYDPKKDKFYQYYYSYNGNAIWEIPKKEIQNYKIGAVYHLSSFSSTGNYTCYDEISILKEAIETSIQEQLKEGRKINEINLFEINDDDILESQIFSEIDIYDNKETWDKKNFLVKVEKELNLSKKDLKILKAKTTEFLQKLAKKCGGLIYVGYNKDKNDFYRMDFSKTNLKKSEYYNVYAKEEGVGTFYMFYKKEDKDNSIYKQANFLGKDIKKLIKEYKNDINEVDFSELLKKYTSKYLNPKLRHSCKDINI